MFLVFLLLLSLSNAYDLVVVNSLDYGDIINGVNYAIFKNTTTLFIPHTYNYDIITLKIGKNRDIFYLEGNPISPLFTNYTFQYNNVTYLRSNNSIETNHVLYREIKPKKVVMVNYYYPDYAVSLLPFAIHNKVFILFVRGNLTEIRDLLDAYTPQEIYLFGPMPAQIEDYLRKKAIIIGTLGEDRYKDSIDLFNYYYDPNKFNHVAMLISGEELEESMVTNAAIPLLLVGDIVPSTIYEFIKEMAKNGTLKGLYIFERKLVSPVYNMKKNIEEQLSKELGSPFKLGLLLKYGQAITSQGGKPSPLGVFLLPIPSSNLQLDDLIYDQTKNALIFGLLNPTSNIEYLAIEGKIFEDGEQKESFLTPLVRLDGGESRAVVVPLNISKFSSKNISVQYIIRYGLYRSSLDKVLTGMRNVIITNYIDPAQLNLTLIDYKNNEVIFILENSGTKTVYAYPKIIYYEKGKQRLIKGSLITLNPGESIQQSFYISLPKNMQNMTVLLDIDYGSKPGLLLKKLHVDYMIKKEVPWFLYLLILILILALVILLVYLIFFIYRKRRKDDKQ